MKSLLSPADQPKIKRILRGKTAFVTGGTGSFGKAIVSALLKYQPKEIRVFSRSEDKQDKMRFQYTNESRITYILGDVRDKAQLIRAMTGSDYVFHAAAQKQVPASEYNVLEAIQTNIIGAQHVIDACFACKVRVAIAISTDKAVEPVNAMGMTKALQEKLFVNANTQRHLGACRFSCVRYGNVLGSTGSVLEVFLKQIASGKKLTVTDQRMTRFLITLDQAVELVFLSLLHATGGEIFIPNIPTHSVVDMANALASLYRTASQKDEPNFRITGIRPGEKLHETLVSPSESARTVIKKRYFVIAPQITAKGEKHAEASKKKQTLFRYSSDLGDKLTERELVEILARHLKKTPTYPPTSR